MNGSLPLFNLRLMINVPDNLRAALSPYMPLELALAPAPTAWRAAPILLTSPASSSHALIDPLPHEGHPSSTSSLLLAQRFGPLSGLIARARHHLIHPLSSQEIIWPAAVLTVQVPQRTPYSPATMLQLVATLLGLKCLMALEIQSEAGHIRHRVVVPAPLAAAARAAVLATVPNAVITVTEPAPPAGHALTASVASATGHSWSPLLTVASARAPDPLSPLLHTLSALGHGQACTFQILVRPAAHLTPPGEAQSEGPHHRLLQEKLLGPHAEALITVGVHAPPHQALSALRSMDMALAAFTTPLNRLCVLPSRAVSVSDRQAALTQYRFAPGQGGQAPRHVILTPAELAALWHLPSEATTADTIVWAPVGSVMAAPQTVAPPRGLYVILGSTTRPDGQRPVALPLADRTTPLLTIGMTGMGKTSFIENLIDQDLQTGRGVAVIDIHGDMTPHLLGHVPVDRVAQTVVIDTIQPEQAVALNPLALGDRIDPNMLVGELISVFRTYFGELWSIGRMEDTTRNVLWALASRPGLSLADMGRLFSDAVFRQQVGSGITNPVVRAYWLNEFPQLSPAQQQERSGVLLNKVRAFLTNDTLRLMLTASACLDLRRHMDGGGILFVRPVGLPEAERTLLSGLVTGLLFAAARSRADTPAAVRRPCYLYLDEAQTLTSSSLPAILAQGRKFGLLCGGLALQYLDALEPATRQSLMGNAGTFVVFRCGPADARLLAPVLAPLEAADLENLDRYQAVCKMQRHGRTMPPFNLTLPDPLQASSPAAIAAVLAASHARYGTREQADNHAEQAGQQPAQRGQPGDGGWEAA